MHKSTSVDAVDKMQRHVKTPGQRSADLVSIVRGNSTKSLSCLRRANALYFLAARLRLIRCWPFPTRSGRNCVKHIERTSSTVIAMVMLTVQQKLIDGCMSSMQAWRAVGSKTEAEF
jgi:hypothetical protein